mgnify:CR=1 FL=1
MLEYVGLGSRPLDLAFRTRAAAHVRIVEFPGRWMAASDQAELLGDLRSVVRDTVPGGSLDYGVLTGSRERWAHAILTIIYDGERAVAFNALTVLPCELRGQPVEGAPPRPGHGAIPTTRAAASAVCSTASPAS